MGKFLLNWLIIAVSVGVAVLIVPGIEVSPEQNGVLVVVVVALILGLVNAVIKPILTLLSCGCLILTLGLFAIVINALMFWLAAEFSRLLGVGFYVESFWAALFGSIIVSVVVAILGFIFRDDD